MEETPVGCLDFQNHLFQEAVEGVGLLRYGDVSSLGEKNKSICVMSPEATIFEPWPMRVKNIFIWARVVFCASSRIMNVSLSVRPRM